VIILLAILVLVTVVAAVAGRYFWVRSGPSLRFVEFRTDAKQQRFAIFRATNPTSDSYSYAAHGPESPFYVQRTYVQRTRTYVVEPDHTESANASGASMYELKPHGSVDFVVKLEGHAEPFAIGVFFIPGTVAEYASGQPGAAFPRRSVAGSINRMLPRKFSINPPLTWSDMTP
jgi:hypothetical protein